MLTCFHSGDNDFFLSQNELVYMYFKQLMTIQIKEVDQTIEFTSYNNNLCLK